MLAAEEEGRRRKRDKTSPMISKDTCNQLWHTSKCLIKHEEVSVVVVSKKGVYFGDDDQTLFWCPSNSDYLYVLISVRKEGKTIRGTSEPPKSLLYTCEYLIVNDETKNGLSW